MRSLRTSTMIGIFTLLMFLLAACGTSSTTSSYGSSNTTAPTPTTSSNTNQNGGKYGTNTSTPTPTTAASTSTAASIKTASATVQGKAVTILTNAQDMTLYYFTPDTQTTTACASGCASNWPPLLFSGTGTPTNATTLPGKLTAVSDSNGMQVQYNGHFLYTFSGDSAAGQVNGEGVGGKWFVATTDLA